MNRFGVFGKIYILIQVKKWKKFAVQFYVQYVIEKGCIFIVNNILIADNHIGTIPCSQREGDERIRGFNKVFVCNTVWAVNYQATNVPELVSFVDSDEVVIVSEDEVPLSNKQVTTSTKTATTTATTIESLAPKVDSKVVSAWNTLGFSFVLNSSVSYSGLFDARSQTITLKSADNTVYHELGHFVAFVAGNIDTSSSFVSVYNNEKNLYTAYNKSYVTQDSSEYFAESFKEYTLDPASLKASRPETYAAIESALAKLTTAQITKIATVYASIWS